MQQGITGSGTHRALTDGLIPLLLVEDTPTDSRLLHELLETAFPGRYLVEVAPSLATAEAAIAKQDYQAILLDLDLPDSRGIDTIKSLFKAARSIPIIVLTGLVDEGVAARAVRCGAQNYLQKGCADAASIAKAIRYAIDRKQQQWEQEALVAILRMANAHHQVRDLIRAVITFLQGWSGCEAVGIRLREGDDFPYFETRGFPAEFVEAENRLCAVDPSGELVRDSQGNPLIECMCGNVLCGRFDPSKPFFTAHGSFWSNGTTELLASTTEADRQARTRNRCNGEGYESVALIPMRADSVTFGLLQFNDRRKNRFTPALIGTLEHLGDNLAIALAHRRSAQMLQESERKYRGLFTEMFSALPCTR